MAKPKWLLYAAEVREQVDKMRPTKSGKRESDAVYRAWLRAQTMGYEGSSKDFEYLVRNYDRVNKGRL